MDERARRDLALLNSIAENDRLTQRTLSTQLGIALGLTNMYLKRFVRKGYVKCVNVQPNRLTYLLTPKGIAEKARLTYEFWDYSLHLYQEVRQHLRGVLAELVARGVARVAIHGTGEAAELAYLSLRELGLEPAAVFGGAGQTFLGAAVRPISEAASVDFDAVIVATFDRPEPMVSELVGQGVAEHLLVTLRKPVEAEDAEGVAVPATVPATRERAS